MSVCLESSYRAIGIPLVELKVLRIHIMCLRIWMSGVLHSKRKDRTCHFVFPIVIITYSICSRTHETSLDAFSAQDLVQIFKVRAFNKAPEIL